MIRLGRVLSQGEIDGLLSSMLEDSTVLPTESDGSAPVAPGTFSPPNMTASTTPSFAAPRDTASTESSSEPAVPAGIAAFKAKLEAAKAAQAAAENAE